MVVHIGVIVIAVALAASNSYTRSQELTLKKGVVASYGGHTFELVGFNEISDDRRTSISALVSIDGGQAYAPAISKFKAMGTNIGTPSVRSSFVKDIYLTLEPPVQVSSESAKIKVFIKPMMMWMWIGGGLMGVGTLLSAYPGSRRRPTDPTSAPVPEAASK
jgi:cytochrome c-type biogenesis protein CcmF